MTWDPNMMMMMQAMQNQPQAQSPISPLQVNMLQMGGGMNPAEKKRLQEAQARYDQAVQTDLSKQSGQIESMQQNLADYKGQEQGLNLAPIASLVDMMNRGQSNMAQQYMQSGLAPENAQQRTDRISKMQKDITTASGKMSDSTIKAMKGNISAMRKGMTASAAARLAESGERNKRFIQTRTEKRKDDFMKFSDKLTKDFTEEARGFSIIEAGLTPDANGTIDYQKVMSTLGQYSRAVAGEKGVLTDQDIQRILPKNFQGGLAKFKAMMSGETPTADLPAGFTAVLLQMTKVAQEKSHEKYKKQLDTNREQTKTVWGNYKELMPILDKGYDNIEKGLAHSFKLEPAKKTYTDEDIDKMTAEEMDAAGL